MMNLQRIWVALTLLTVVPSQMTLAQKPGTATKQEVQAEVDKWLEKMTGPGKVYKATFRAKDGSPLTSKPVNNRIFAFQENNLYLSLVFSKAPGKNTSLKELQETFQRIALDRIPVPGVETSNWETRLQTPFSSFNKGVTLESWKDGVLRVRVQTEFFAAYGRRTDILVPADAGTPENMYFQIRKPVKADLVIEGRLFPAKK